MNCLNCWILFDSCPQYLVSPRTFQRCLYWFQLFHLYRLRKWGVYAYTQGVSESMFETCQHLLNVCRIVNMWHTCGDTCTSSQALQFKRLKVSLKMIMYSLWALYFLFTSVVINNMVYLYYMCVYWLFPNQWEMERYVSSMLFLVFHQIWAIKWLPKLTGHKSPSFTAMLQPLWVS